MLDRIHGFWEMILGLGLLTTTFWGHALDEVMIGAHAFATIGGAVIAAHGLWRIWRKHNRRNTDVRSTQ